MNNDVKINVDIDSSKAQTGFKSIRDELKSLKSDIAAGKFGDKELKEATKRAAELTDHLGDVRESIKSLSSDTAKIDAVVEGFRGLAGAVSVGVGAAALFGVENENLQKTLTQVNGAMAVLVGIQELSNLALGQGALKTYALAAADAVAATATEVLGVTITATMAAATAGISLLVAGIVYLATSMGDAGDSAEEVAKKAEANLELSKSFTDKQVNLIKDGKTRELQAAKVANERELQELDRKQKAGILSTDDYWKYVDIQTATYNQSVSDINQKYADKDAKSKDDKLKKEKAENEKKKSEAAKDAADKAAADKIQEDLKDQYLLNDRQRLEKKYDEDVKVAGKDLKLQKGILDAKKIALDEYDANELKAKQDKADAEYKIVEDRVKAEVAADKAGDDQMAQNKANRDQIMNEYKVSFDDVEDQFAQIRLDNKTLNEEQIYKIIAERYKKTAELSKKEVEEDKKNQQKKFDNARAITNAVAGLGNALADIIGVNAKKGSEAEKKAAKTRFNVNKAAGMASAGINVAEAITKAIAAGPGYGQAMAIIAAATGAVQLAAIAAKQFNPESGSTPDTTIVTPAGPSPLPDGGGGGIPNAGQSFDLGLNSVLKGPEYNMQRVYVTETDISRVQGRVKVVETRSTLN